MQIRCYTDFCVAVSGGGGKGRNLSASYGRRAVISGFAVRLHKSSCTHTSYRKPLVSKSLVVAFSIFAHSQVLLGKHW